MAKEKELKIAETPDERAKALALAIGKIEKELNYEVWYCGHYHIDKQIDKINMMCHEIRPLHMQLVGDE